MTADKASFNITIPGKEMVFGSTHYLPYLLFKGGAGLWPGKREELVDLMKRGFISGVTEYKAQGQGFTEENV